MKYYFITGERSGDLHASNLAAAIRKKDPVAEFRGVGGDHLRAAGASFIFEYRYLSFMGFFDTLIRLGRFLRAIKDIKKDIVGWGADAVIFVDFAAFNMRIVPFTVNHDIPSFYYISPKVWAWNTGRAKKIKKWVRNMFVILPFEKDFYKQFDYNVKYVGNPVKDAIKAYVPVGLDIGMKEGTGKKVALLPGSRKQEVINSLEVFELIVQDRKDVTFIVAAVNNLDQSLYSSLLKYENVKVFFDRNYDVLAISDAAIVTSGTATLETALLGVPQVVVYRTNAFNYAIASRLIKVDYISLVNLIAGKEVIREMIQKDFNPGDVGNELDKLLYDTQYRSELLSGYGDIDQRLGDKSPSETVAKQVVESLTG